MLGGSGYERVENDFYPTEEACSVALYRFLREHRLINRHSPVYEPACGDGAISNVYSKFGHKVISSDLHPQMAGAYVRDFLTEPLAEFDPNGERPVLITNPPYAKPWLDKFIKRAVELVSQDGIVAAFLMRNEVDCANGRAKFFRDSPFYFGKQVLLWRPRWIPGSTGSPRHNYAWYIWAPKEMAFQSVINYSFKPKV